MLLTTTNHDRDIFGMTYVYPVVSRRAGGVSLGINLNPNNACNWHCAYCQVPNLIRGVAPDINLLQLEQELGRMLSSLLHGDFMQQHVKEDYRKFCDVAISGNGEPTSCKSFDAVVAVIIDVMNDFDVVGKIPLRLISNGSYVHKPHVLRGLQMMAEHRGEVWVKIDAVTEIAIQRMNGISTTEDLLFQQVSCVAKACPTWIQTCMLAWDGVEPSDSDIVAYIFFLQRLKDEAVPVLGVLLYGLARASMQVEAQHVSALDHGWMQRLKIRIEALGFEVRLAL
ncbi:MAG: radical SAM protein [Mariprofundaceae bacterium]